MSTSPMTVAFLGASTGIGLAALKHTLAAGHQCIALCRTPPKLTDILPPSSYPNLKVLQGNAHDVGAVAQLLRKESDGNIVDKVVSTIGGKPAMSTKFLDDPEVCQKGMSTLLEALDQLRRQGATGRPHIIVCSTTGMSKFGRDIPLAMVPLYHLMLKVPHADKKIMEERLFASGEEFTVVQPSFLMNGESNKTIRVGIEDPVRGRESTAIGYAISREDAGRWFAENLLNSKNPKYVNKIAKITW
ncbi:NAD(P)-binding protein [Cryphonectria parasitica EP155]|uniref:NAD(P)-binding protein n=1 Tax=Cryphonectria parasitica (strain ATCC 38755 / EP155) TaxID=660469 RepID=A0A9P4XVD6_CRYP1|nr:NAD(P)-binding protein [Cryphonectria parasitica EP155]KAF3761611.1 NAD(P)-binding protein [Cryphonectria parasitica EP155]